MHKQVLDKFHKSSNYDNQLAKLQINFIFKLILHFCAEFLIKSNGLEYGAVLKQSLAHLLKTANCNFNLKQKYTAMNGPE